MTQTLKADVSIPLQCQQDPCLVALCSQLSCLVCTLHLNLGEVVIVPSLRSFLAAMILQCQAPVRTGSGSCLHCDNSRLRGSHLYLAPLDWPCALPLLVCSTLLVERCTPWPGQNSSSSESGPSFSAASALHNSGLRLHMCAEQNLYIPLRRNG